MDSKQNKVIHLNWSNLPSEAQLKIIWDGIENTSSGKAAILFLKNLGSVNQLLRKFIKNNSPFLIELITRKYDLPKWAVVFYLGSLSKKDCQERSPEKDQSLSISQENGPNGKNYGMAIPYRFSSLKYPSYSSKHSPSPLHSSYDSLGGLLSNSLSSFLKPYSSKYSPDLIQSVWSGSTPEEDRNFYKSRAKFYATEKQSEERYLEAKRIESLRAFYASEEKGAIYEETEDELHQKEELRQRDEKYCQREMQKSLFNFVLVGNYENVLGLLENKINPNFETDNGYTPLYIAIYKNHPKIAELLLTYEANPNPKGKDDMGCTPLIWASIKGEKSLVDSLIQNGARLDEVDNFGLTALTKACLNGHLEIVESLLSSGADPQIKDKIGQTVYNHAVIGGNSEMISLLKGKAKTISILKEKEKVKSLSQSDGALLTSEGYTTPPDDFFDFGEEGGNLKSGEWQGDIAKLIFSYDLPCLLALNDTLDENLSGRTDKIKDLIRDRIRIILQI